jgi:hypothetical protein
MRWNVLLSLSENPAPGMMIDDVPPSVYNIFAFAILTRV